MSRSPLRFCTPSRNPGRRYGDVQSLYADNSADVDLFRIISPIRRLLDRYSLFPTL